MFKLITESEVEQAALEMLSGLGYDAILNGPNIALYGASPESASYSDVVLVDRLRSAIDSFNPERSI